MNLLPLYEQLFEATARGGMQNIIDAAYSVIRMPITVTDVLFKNLALAPSAPIGDNIWDTMLQYGGAPQEMVVEFHKEKYMQAVYTEKPPYYVDWGECEQLPRIQEVIQINDVVEGYVAILCPKEKYGPWCDQAATAIAKACTIELERTFNHHIEGNPLSHALVKELFENRVTTPQQLQLWEKSLNVSLTGESLLFCIQAHYSRNMTVLKYMLYQLKQCYPRQLSLLKEDVLLLILYGLGEKEDTDNIQSRIGKILMPFNARCGVSRRFSDLFQLEVYRFQAEQSLRIGMNTTKDRFVYSYDDYAMPIILAGAMAGTVKSNWLSPAITRVADYDRDNGTNYLDTLEVYVMEICSNAKTVEKLHIHRNTLLYRLNKIEEIIGLPITDPEQYTHLLLSFQMLRMERDQAADDLYTSQYK